MMTDRRHLQVLTAETGTSVRTREGYYAPRKSRPAAAERNEAPLPLPVPRSRSRFSRLFKIKTLTSV